MIMIEFILWIIVDISLFFIASFFLLRFLKEKEKPSEFFFFSIFFFFICTAVQRLLSLIFDFFISDLFLLFLLTLINIISAIPLLFHLERTVLHSKQIFSIVVFIFVGVYFGVYLIMGYDRYFMYFIFTPAYAIVVGVPGLIYLYLLVKSSGSVRTSLFLIIIGIGLVLVFWGMHGNMSIL